MKYFLEGFQMVISRVDSQDVLGGLGVLTGLLMITSTIIIIVIALAGIILLVNHWIESFR